MTTLKISDLSVGDWVMVNDNPRKISVLANVWDGSNEVLVGYVAYVYSNGHNVVFYKPIEKVKPIPITAEILEKNRIHKTYEDDNYAIFRGDGLWAVKYSDGDWELSIPPVGHVDIRYIHQLQHALRLAGVDQEITL